MDSETRRGTAPLPFLTLRPPHTEPASESLHQGRNYAGTGCIMRFGGVVREGATQKVRCPGDNAVGRKLILFPSFVLLGASAITNSVVLLLHEALCVLQMNVSHVADNETPRYWTSTGGLAPEMTLLLESEQSIERQNRLTQMLNCNLSPSSPRGRQCAERFCSASHPCRAVLVRL